jgi:hypothetical protein
MTDTASFTETTYTPDRLCLGGPYDSRAITLLSGQNCARGAVLGKITASGKYKLSAAAAGDGSEVPDVILAEACDASVADKTALVYINGRFNDASITLGAGHTVASIRDGLQDRRGILLINDQGA